MVLILLEATWQEKLPKRVEEEKTETKEGNNEK